MPDDEYGDWQRGSGRRTPGPLIDAYVESDAIDRPCPSKVAGGCGAAVNDFCRHPDGHDRKIPCVARYRDAVVVAPVDARVFGAADLVARQRSAAPPTEVK